MKKICMAALILISGIMASCVTKSNSTALSVILKPSIGFRKDIGIAD
ncbi:hypothetical protein [Mucilaginibacter psychrotolerans]|nr:hypothetical protein [Mucilaginibacter psychrotolerans]